MEGGSEGQKMRKESWGRRGGRKGEREGEKEKAKMGKTKGGGGRYRHMKKHNLCRKEMTCTSLECMLDVMYGH